MQETLNQRSGARGEISPDLAGRTDIQQYQSAFAYASNVEINKRGILFNSPGSEMVLPGKFPTKKTRSIPFKFSFNQQYDMIFGNGYIHFIKNGSPIFIDTGQAIFSATNANPGVFSLSGMPSNYANGQMCRITATPLAGVNGPNDLPNTFSKNVHNRFFILANVNTGALTMTLKNLDGTAVDTTSWGASGALSTVGYLIERVYEVPTIYADTDLDNLTYAQSFDVVQLRHPTYPRYQIERFADTEWGFTKNNCWPSQNQLGSSLAVSGGTAGAVNYYYKFSTYNRTTRQESLPCPILNLSVGASTAVVSGVQSGYTALIAVTSAGSFSVGQAIAFSSDLYNSGGTITFFGNNFYTIVAITGNILTMTSPVYMLSSNSNLFFNGGTTAYFNSGATTTRQIASISSANPMVITTTVAHGLTDGQEVTIQGTGVFGLDGLTFNATVQSTTTVSLNGVNGANYDLSGFVSSPSTTISSTTVISTTHVPDSTNPITITGKLLDSQAFMNDIVFLIYASTALNSGFGFIGTAIPSKVNTNFTFVDKGIPPDTTLSPKSYNPIFIGTGNYPSACAYYQQRLLEFSADNNPQGLWASVIGDYNDFSFRDPIREDDAIIVDVASNELQRIFSSAEAGFLILMTDLGPMIVSGDQTGVFSPNSKLIKRQMFAGASQQPRPLTIFKEVIYLECSQKSIRSLEILSNPYYTYISKSDDVSIYSGHLFQESKVVKWDYKQYPDSQVHMVREDGEKIIQTYLTEQQINGFTRRITDGEYLDVVAVQEGSETAIYDTVQRDSGPWIERVASRYYSDITVDAIFTDSSVSYNGLISDGTTAVLSGSTSAQGVIVATLSTSTGGEYSVGWQVNFKDASGNIARMKVTGTTATTVTGTLFEAIKPAMIGATISDIRICSNVVCGLWHLEGEEVTVVADGWVVANPNDDNALPITVSNGCISLPASFGVITVGLPYIWKLRTLSADQTQGETFMDKKMTIKRVTLKLLDTGDILVGPDFSDELEPGVKMDRPKFRQMEGYDNTTGLFTGIIPVNMDGVYGFGGQLVLEGISPLPTTILSIAALTEIQKG